ncbi:MAG: TM1266 family iron-only hydrogenase system putative regulator [Bacillota bacterium]
MPELAVMGILVRERDDRAPGVQEVLTRYGSEILCRMGIPSPSKERGLITIVMEGKKADALQGDLLKISGVEVKRMVFADY